MIQKLKNKTWLILTLTLLITGCAGTWTRVDNTNRIFKNNRYRVSLPIGWVHIAINDDLLITRDGIGIQRIEVLFKPHEDAFEKLEESSSADILTGELAELYIAELKAQDANGLPSLDVITNEPTEIGGHHGFQLHLKFTAENGLHHESLVKGFTNSEGYYVLRYTAPSLHFFSKHKDVFQNVVKDFKPKNSS